MTIARNLAAQTYDFDYDALRRGYFSDTYFLNGTRVLQRLSEQGVLYAGESPRQSVAQIVRNKVLVGDIVVEMQYFTSRKPFTIAAGVDAAITILRECSGYFDREGKFTGTGDKLEIEAVPEGCRLAPFTPALKVRGRYRDFGAQETTTLGVLARASLVATDVFRVLEAGCGTPVFFFPARFDVHTTQAIDGYAYRVAVRAFNAAHGTSVPPLVSTEAQGRWWGGAPAGTMPHAYILCFFADCPEAMLAFAKTMPPEVRRAALVDTDNDCVGTSARTAAAMFDRHIALLERGDCAEAERFRLFAVRADTARRVRDVSVEPLGCESLDLGVCPRLITAIRNALDHFHESAEIPEKWRSHAREYFSSIKIIASGGFDERKVNLFTRLGVPVDYYGIGSYFRSGTNDYTADIVRVKVDGRWHDMAKVGRAPWENPELERVQ